MKTKILSLLLFILVSILSACSPASVAIPTEEVPAPVVEGEGYEAVQIDDVQVEVGVGSPMGEVRLHRDGTAFFIRLVASLSQNRDCAEDSIPFRLEIPLNIVNLPEGPYDVNVNGATAVFDPRTSPVSP